jgi:hypothetical protein
MSTPRPASQSLPPMEVQRFADHHGPDLELPDQATAVPAGRQGGDHDAVPVVTPPSGVAEGGRLGVAGRIVVLDPPVVSPAEQGPVAMEEGGTDGDAPFGQTAAGFVQGDGQEAAVR